ncbi:MAG TPA: hypothetical protein VJN71_09285 [Nitrososphaerales archaeon]|nr:hypothetical protein [Nitrososphaerales archaeon]
MSVNLVQFVNGASSVIQAVILVVGLARVLEMRAGFVDRTYRQRAFWSVLLMGVVAAVNIESLLPLPSDLIVNIIGIAIFFGLIGIAFAFIDRTALVAIQQDFFHRDILGWKRFRIPAGLVLAASLIVAFLLVPKSLLTNPPLWVSIGENQTYIIAAILLGYAAIVGLIGSMRTPDKTLKKNIRFLGISLGFFVLSLAIFTLLSNDLGSIIGDIATIFATTFLYLSAMSLTPLGRTARDALEQQGQGRLRT